MASLLAVENLKTYFNTEYGLVKAADGVTFYVNHGEIIGLVGESGCGKSVSILSVMQLIQSPGEIVDGKIMLEGQDLRKYKSNGPEMRAIRGSRMTMIFQEPMTSLNPVLTICRQLTETLELHLQMDRQAARERAIELLRMVGVPDALLPICRGKPNARRWSQRPGENSAGSTSWSTTPGITARWFRWRSIRWRNSIG